MQCKIPMESPIFEGYFVLQYCFNQSAFCFNTCIKSFVCDNQSIKFLKFVDEAFGFGIAESTPIISDDLRRKIDERVAAKAEKNYARADELRDEILAQGIELLDGADKVIWKYKG